MNHSLFQQLAVNLDVRILVLTIFNNGAQGGHGFGLPQYWPYEHVLVVESALVAS